MHKLSPVIVFAYIVSVVCLFLAGVYYHYSFGHRETAIATARTYMASIRAVHNYYSEEIIPRAENAGVLFDPQYQDFDDRLPFPGTVAMDLGRALSAADPNLDFSLYSDHPFEWNKDRVLDEFEQESLRLFESGETQEYVKFEGMDGRTLVRLAVPVEMTESCVQCHNQPVFGLGRTWKIGDFRGARQVAVPVHTTDDLPDYFVYIALIGALAIGSVGVGFVWPVVRRLDRALDEKTKDMETLSATEDMLRQSQKLEAVGLLTSGIAHDFNNLLAVVRGNAELNVIDPSQNKKNMAEILQASDRGAAMIRQLLAFSRKQTLHPEPVDLSNITANMSEVLKRTLGRDTQLVLSSDEDLWLALADRNQVETALLNLVLNAKDAIGGKGTVHISCKNFSIEEGDNGSKQQATSGDYLMLSVIDNGAGMSQQEKESAMEPFFTTKTVGEGSGLGLSMIHGFAQQSGGFLEIESEENCGTSVRLFLPRAL